ncbi:hypothetical protein D6874_08630, partial [Campylobacter jejuni]|nr:hypothetical protein [Campylobacter jejuni]
MSSSCKTYSTKITLKSLKSTNAKSNAIIEAVANSIDANSKNIYINIQKGNGILKHTFYALMMMGVGFLVMMKNLVWFCLNLWFQIKLKQDMVKRVKVDMLL